MVENLFINNYLFIFNHRMFFEDSWFDKDDTGFLMPEGKLTGM
jgi:hypothetical protein